MAKHRRRWLSAFANRLASKPLTGMRQRLDSNDALLTLSVLGILSGILAASVIMLFRWAIDAPLMAFLPGGLPENFEALSPMWRFLLPAGGGLALGLAMAMLNRNYHSVGLAHVIHVTNNLHGELPLKNALTQFFAGAVAIVTGQSGGREGPAVHLGAAITSRAAYALHLPRSSSRILISCGTAAAIAASFNTPIAGVIFAMEVVMLEYTIAGLTPVILAAITATLLSRDSFGTEPMLLIDVAQSASFSGVLSIALIGIVCGAIAASFVGLQKLCLRWSHLSPIWRLSAAGIITGAVAIYVPQVLGLGYDTMQQTLSSEIVGLTLLLIIFCKLLVTAISCGLGMPLGFIGPALIIGAGIGHLIGAYSLELMPADDASITMYVLLGMGAFMAAILNAPLAALLAIVELTHSASIMFPGMLAVIAATLTSNGVLRQDSAQHATLLSQGFKIQSDPLSLALQRASVSGLMDRNFRRISHKLTENQVQQLLQNRPRWLVVTTPDEGRRLLDSTDLVLHMEERNAEIAAAAEAEAETQSDGERDDSDSSAEKQPRNDNISLLDLPGRQRQLADIHPQATLREALERMNAEQADALYVSGPAMALYIPPSGIITRDDIENYYRHPQRRSTL